MDYDQRKSQKKYNNISHWQFLEHKMNFLKNQMN